MEQGERPSRFGVLVVNHYKRRNRVSTARGQSAQLSARSSKSTSEWQVAHRIGCAEAVVRVALAQINPVQHMRCDIGGERLDREFLLKRRQFADAKGRRVSIGHGRSGVFGKQAPLDLGNPRMPPRELCDQTVIA